MLRALRRLVVRALVCVIALGRSLLVLIALLVLILVLVPVTALRVMVPLLQGSPRTTKPSVIYALGLGIYTAVSLAATLQKD